ncbi:MAG: response regulator [bacterium]|nr:response regulator [bacterium]
MVAVLVILTVVVFFLVDLALRVSLKKIEQSRQRREREKALDIGLKLEFADEARSLKRVTVEKPKARILAIDDEPVILDSFRKILVLAGYSVDTVETGQEALSLLRKNDYDFVFTDLKMPGLDGLDVTKASKHLRPDIDVVMITGYATIESAVDAMKYGAMDYVQKPFTEDELVDFTDQLVIRRQDRIERQTPPRVRLVTASSQESESNHVVNVPGGIFVSPHHTWVSVEVNGEARIGLDDFIHKSLGPTDDITFPDPGTKVRKGAPLFTISRGERSLTFPSPLDGKITRANHELTYHLDLLRRRPYQLGWICSVEPDNLSADLTELTIGCDAVPWYEQEIVKLRSAAQALEQEAGDAQEPGANEESRSFDLAWSAFAHAFLNSQAA